MLSVFTINPQIHKIAFSDHAPISVELSGFTIQNFTKIWHFLTYIAHDQSLQKIIKEMWNDYSIINSEHTANPTLLWEAGKAVLWGKMISYSSAQKKFSREYTEASKALRTAQTLLSHQNSPENREIWRTVKNHFDLWAEAQERPKSPVTPRAAIPQVW